MLRLAAQAPCRLRPLSSNVRPTEPMKRLLALFLLAPLCALADVVLFAGSVAQADIPPGYEHHFEEQRRTLVVSPVGSPKIELRFTFNSLRPHIKQRPTIGKDFVLDASKKKDKLTFQVPENGGVGFVDFTETRVHGSERVQATHGMMGLDDGYVTFTISVEESLLPTPPAKQVLESGFKVLLGRIRSRGA
jgi:hypothetical protein